MDINRHPAAPVIAIDGPSASGKGTVASRVAAELGFHSLESGALYRLVALAAQRRKIAEDDESQLAQIAATLDVCFQGGDVYLENQQVGSFLREEECGRRASSIAKLPDVRAALLERQRGFRIPPGLVADGRDMGTVVFPDAVLKVFLTASVAARAQRRYKQLKEKGFDASLAALSRDLEARDAQDANRSVAPLKPAHDAKELDSTDLSIEEVVARIVAWWREREVTIN
ncbi:MAG: (d)CMP kinase [Betaproteobacteria bacterium]|nr:(d)CMP kinase [Betaproteobacteria bacterium]